MASVDSELQTIRRCVQALDSIEDDAARMRAIHYLAHRYGVIRPAPAIPEPSSRGFADPTGLNQP